MAAKKSNQKREAGERWVVPVDGLEIAFRWCPDGMFMMGPPESQHEVKLTKGFWIMETPVTVGMFMKFVANTDFEDKGRKPYVWEEEHGGKYIKFSWKNPSNIVAKNSSWPATCVFWDDAVAFCEWLKDKTELTMRLPTEAEWEYACRAGETKAPTFEELEKMAWLPIKGEKRIHPVAKKNPNAWYIYDMVGNVWEWCQDWYGKNFTGESVTDPTGPKDGKCKVIRGGCFASIDIQLCQPTSRDGLSSYEKWKFRNNYLGFRVVCVSDQQ